MVTGGIRDHAGIFLEYPWEHSEAYICKAFNTACESGDKDTSAGNLEGVTVERTAEDLL